jgi:hypothetical protein
MQKKKLAIFPSFFSSKIETITNMALSNIEQQKTRAKYDTFF